MTTIETQPRGRGTSSPESRPAAPPIALALALAGLAAVAIFVYFFRLDAPSWLGDEVVYRDAGYEYVHGNFERALENPPLVKYLLGVAQLVGGSGKLAMRAPAAAAGLLTGVVLLLFARRAAGIWAGVMAFGLWILLPRPELLDDVDIGRVKIDRYARQEVFMAFLAMIALYAGWRWARSGRWRPALVGGAALGLATACKAPAVLALPAILLCGLVELGVNRRSLLQAAAVVGVTGLVAAVTYVPMLGEAPHAIDFMFSASEWRNTIGHPFVFDGELHQYAPWWANLWWQWKSLGTPAALAVAACLALAPFVLSRSLAVLLLAAVLVPACFFAFWLSYALPYYYYAWQPPLVLLCALVLHRLFTGGTGARVAGGLLALPLAFVGVSTVLDVGRIDTRDYAAVASELGPGLGDRTAVTWDLDSYTSLGAELPEGTVAFTPYGRGSPGAIIVDPASSERRRNAAVLQFVRANRSDLRLLRIDRLRVFVPRSPAAERRLAASAERGPRNRPGVTAISTCLTRAGLPPRIGTASPGANAQSMRSPLPGDRSAIVWVYRSESSAAAAVSSIGRFLEAGGGGASVSGRVVIGFAGAPTADERRRVVDCASRGS